MERTTEPTNPHTTTDVTILPMPAGPTPPGHDDIMVTADLVAALLYLSPFEAADWHTNGPTFVARYIVGIVVRAADNPAVRLTEVADLFARGDFPPGYPLDHERLATARGFARRVMHALLTTA